MSINRCMDKEDVAHRGNGILLSYKKNEMPFAATWMQLEIIILSEVRERQLPYDITYMWNLKYGTNERIYKTEIDSDIENRLVAAKGGRGGGREE